MTIIMCLWHNILIKLQHKEYIIINYVGRILVAQVDRCD